MGMTHIEASASKYHIALNKSVLIGTTQIVQLTHRECVLKVVHNTQAYMIQLSVCTLMWRRPWVDLHLISKSTELNDVRGHTAFVKWLFRK